MNFKSFSFLSLIVVCFIALGLVVGCSTTPNVKIVSATKTKSPTSIPVVKVFLENSGSMDGYMCDGSEFKDAIYSYLSAVNNHTKSMKLYYINSDTIRRNVKLNQYVRDLNPSNFKAAGGNRSFTDISKLFERFFSNVDSNSVCIYISDCILDIPNNAAPNYLNITRVDIHNCVTDQIKAVNNMAVCVYQLESKYDGSYYFPKGGSKPYSGNRPYYMIIAGPQNLLAFMRNAVPDANLTHGVKNYCAFSPFYEASATIIKGSKQVVQIPLNTKQRDGYYKFNVLVDLSYTLQSDAILTNNSNYEWLNQNDLLIDSILTIEGNQTDYTHSIRFSATGSVMSDIFKLKNIGLPLWVAQSNDTKGDSIDASKTFGIEYIIGGISDAYSNIKENTSFKLNITKK